MTDTISSWFAGRLPDEWSAQPPAVTVDRDEILVVLTLPDLTGEQADDRDAAAGRIARFREDTREHRIGIAREAEHRFDRAVAWGARVGETQETFTSRAAPVMTRLRQPERIVLDTLVDAGVARSRSHALTWCVKLVGEHSEAWLASLRGAMRDVERIREQSPVGES